MIGCVKCGFPMDMHPVFTEVEVCEGFIDPDYPDLDTEETNERERHEKRDE